MSDYVPRFAITYVPGADPEVHRPRKEHLSDACMDVFARLDAPVKLGFGDRASIPLGFRLALQPGWECQVRSRSGNALNKGWMVMNSPGTVDAGYRGEVCAIIGNFERDGVQTIVPGQKIAQIKIERVPSVVLCEIEERTFERLYGDTKRKSKGFGSSGDK